MPWQVATEKYTAILSAKPDGEYWLAIKFYNTKSGEPVEIGLSTKLKYDYYFKVQEISF